MDRSVVLSVRNKSTGSECSVDLRNPITAPVNYEQAVDHSLTLYITN
jgi:hypothetical protein